MKKGILALFGSGEFTLSMTEVDKYLLEKLNNPKVAVIPTAAGKEKTFNNWIKKGERYYKKIGVKVRGFNIYGSTEANSIDIAEELEDYNYFVFSGGDPGYLLDSINESLIWEVIKQRYLNGAFIVGSSAGAMVMGKKVWSKIYDFDKKGEIHPWEDGLMLTDFGIIPHFDVIPKYFSKDKILQMTKNFPEGERIVGIDEDTAYINIDDKWEIKGKGNVTT